MLVAGDVISTAKWIGVVATAFISSHKRDRGFNLVQFNYCTKKQKNAGTHYFSILQRQAFPQGCSTLLSVAYIQQRRRHVLAGVAC